MAICDQSREQVHHEVSQTPMAVDLPRKYVPVSMLVWQALEQVGRLVWFEEQEVYTREHYEA